MVGPPDCGVSFSTFRDVRPFFIQFVVGVFGVCFFYFAFFAFLLLVFCFFIFSSPVFVMFFGAGYGLRSASEFFIFRLA